MRKRKATSFFSKYRLIRTTADKHPGRGADKIFDRTYHVIAKVIRSPIPCFFEEDI